MRIRRLEVFTARLPLEPGFSHFTGRVTALEEVFVRLTADEGHVGWGEVRGNMSYFSGESPASIVAALRDYLAPLVVGRPLRERAPPGSVRPGARRNAAAKAALDIALHDLAARAPASALPLARRPPGGAVAARVPLLRPADEAAAQARGVAQGFRILKVRVGLEPFALDVERVGAIREAVGSNVSLAVDANQAWTVKQAIARIHALERFGLDCVEQPVAARDLTGMAEVARVVDTPLMADESLYSLEDAMALVRLGAVGYFHVKLVKAGGLRRARQLIALAEAARLATCWAR
jgi:L-alanine-DL-glutamate epimerase-like enolase superfamily enzyme